MKVCPTCRKTYTDDGLNFCLDDGSLLTVAGGQMPETVMMNQARPTDPSPTLDRQKGQTSLGNPAAYPLQPKKSSKTWIWVLGILGLLVVLCGGGGIGALVIYKASVDRSRDSRPTPSPAPSLQRSTPSPTATPTPFSAKDVKEIDLEDWVRKDSAFGNTEFRDGEFFMSSKKKGYYYVVAAPADYKTELATTSVVLRNVDDANSTLGYGLVFHSDPRPLEKDYAFIIDTKRQKYRVARHEPGTELDVINWTDSSAIKSGTQENTLEVRDTPSRIELYINGEMVTSIKNTYGYKGGVAGLYSGDAVNIGFKKLQIAK